MSTEQFNRGETGFTVRGEVTASRSWWVAQTREAFRAAAEREADRLKRSEMARRLHFFTVGWDDRISGRRAR